jgi:predicted aspartyl protease
MRVLTASLLMIVLFWPRVTRAEYQFDVRLEMTDSSLVLVPLRVNGSGPYRFVLDTAATTTMLDARFATRLGLVASGSIDLVSSGGNFHAQSGYVDELAIGPVHVRRLPVSWTSLDVIRRHDTRIVGILGQDVLSRISVTLDFDARRVRFGEEPCGDGDLTVDVERVDGRPAIPARVSGPGVLRDGVLVIDSAANTLILFGQPDVALAGLDLDTHAGPARATRVPAVDVAIGDVVLRRDAMIVRSTTDRIERGLLPASWFSRVCIDGPRGRAVLTRVHRRSPRSRRSHALAATYANPSTLSRRASSI